MHWQNPDVFFARIAHALLDASKMDMRCLVEIDTRCRITTADALAGWSQLSALLAQRTGGSRRPASRRSTAPPWKTFLKHITQIGHRASSRVGDRVFVCGPGVTDCPARNTELTDRSPARAKDNGTNSHRNNTEKLKIVGGRFAVSGRRLSRKHPHAHAVDALKSYNNEFAH
jgi:hypothetical protein